MEYGRLKERERAREGYLIMPASGWNSIVITSLCIFLLFLSSEMQAVVG